MTKSLAINEVVDEIHQSILATQKKQRRIRSGTFWHKFGFERRTKERVDSVRTALIKQGIEMSLDESLFGSERRGELIIFKQAESKLLRTIKKSKDKVKDAEPSGNSNKFSEPAFQSVHKYDQIEAKLKRLAEVEHVSFETAYVFSVLFVAVFWHDTPNYELSPGVFGATRSNWTYHTAAAVSQTCKILELTCKFEALGKRDAVIETKVNPEIIIVAEWEWDYDDIFGKDKELDKLKTTCKKHPTADAFLLTYCPISKYLNYLERIAEYWISETVTDKQAPTLFLHVIIFEEKGGNREFKRLKTVMIHPEGIKDWADNYL